MRANIVHGVTGLSAFVASQIVQDDDIAGFEGWDEALLDPWSERDPADRAIEHEGCDNAAAAQASQKGQRPPVTVRDLCDQRFFALAPAAGAYHVSS